MTATRPGLFDGRFLTLFPRKLTNTSVSPTLLPAAQYARQLRNILPNRKKAGSGSMRFGLGVIMDNASGFSDGFSDGFGSGAQTDILDGWEYRSADGTVQIIVYTDDGKLRLYDEGLHVYSDLRTGISLNGSMGAVQFNNKLIFYNGIDANFVYDGISCKNLGEYVTDYQGTSTSAQQYGLASSPVWDSSNSFHLTPSPGRMDYPVGRNVQVTFANAGITTAPITVSNLVGGVLYITVAGNPFPSSSQVITNVSYYASPPPFSFMYAENDILWALSGGELHPRVFRGRDGAKVYYTTAANNENTWYSQGTTESTQELAYISVQNKLKGFDELVGISSYQTNMVFHGRNQLVIYQGYDPSVVTDFVWIKTIPVGTVHGKLIQKMPTDIGFVTPYGLRSLSTVLVNGDVEITDDLGTEIDASVDFKLMSLLTTDEDYRKARSFSYPREGIFAWKMDDESLNVYVENEKSRGWTEFTGMFANAHAFIPLTDGRLIVANNSLLLAYGNGSDSTVGIVYNDVGIPIECTWWLPWLASGGRWSNRAFEILLEDTSAVTFNLDRMIDFNEKNIVSTQAPLFPVVNPVVSDQSTETIVANTSQSSSQWDQAQWDVDSFDAPVVNPVVSDKFLADQAFSIRLSFSSTTGPINMLGLRPIGR